MSRNRCSEGRWIAPKAMKWIILTIFFLGTISSLNWHETVRSTRKTVYGIVAIASFVVVLVLGSTMP